jgi:hypothetical protein
MAGFLQGDCALAGAGVSGDCAGGGAAGDEDSGVQRAKDSERGISLEPRAKALYRAPARGLEHQGVGGPFFTAPAGEGKEHADLLEVCRAAALRAGWNVNVFNPWLDYLPRLEEQMDAAEDAVRRVDSVDAALRLVIQIELSEVNEVFRAAMAATDTAFVKRLRPFRVAMEAHMAYIMERLPELSPGLMQECRELRARFPKIRA